MALPTYLPSPSRMPGMIALAAGASLTLAAVVYFFAWNWHALSGTTRFSLAGGGALMSLALALAAERKRHDAASSIALFSAALFTGLFWTVFGQVFQSGATTREFCLAWAVTTAPIFLLRRTALLWNLLVPLLIAAVCASPLIEQRDAFHTTHLLAPLLVAAASCAIALLPPSTLRRAPGLNAWLLLPLTILLAMATALCSLHILFTPLQYHPSLAESLAGPVTFALVLVPALRARHAPTLCLLALCAVILMNVALFRSLERLDDVELATAFTLANSACAFFLVATLPKFAQWKGRPRLRLALAHAPVLLGGFLAALSLIALTALFFNNVDFSTTLLYAGLAYMTLGSLLWRVRGKSTFVAVLGSVLVTGGSFCFHIGLLEYSAFVILASVWGAAAILYTLLDYPPLRFSAVFWALVSTILFLPSVLAPNTPVIVSVFLVCFLPLFAAAADRFPHAFLRPAAFACLCVTLLISPSFPPISPLRIDLGSMAKTITASIAVLNLAALLWRSLPPQTSPSYPKPTERAAAVLVMLTLWLLSPLEHLIAMNLFFAGLGKRDKPGANAAAHASETSSCDKPLMLLGVLALISSLFLFYYLTELTFRTKMTDIGVPGLCLLCTGLWMERRTRDLASTDERASASPPLARQALPFLLCSVALVFLFGAAIADKKAILLEGRDVMLALTPQDPRAFMLGDYMALRYDVDNLLLPKDEPACLPLTMDESGRATASKDNFLEGNDCADAPVPALRAEKDPFGDTRLRLPRRYYFEEGLGYLYESAAFAVLRFDGTNRFLLRGLADKNGRLIRPEKNAPPSR